jgi:serine-aspartate repeat-containing protein C/D/E
VKRSSYWFLALSSCALVGVVAACGGAEDPEPQAQGESPLQGPHVASQIGVFRSGTWWLDANGNGAWGAHDITFAFGDPNAMPLVGSRYFGPGYRASTPGVSFASFFCWSDKYAESVDAAPGLCFAEHLAPGAIPVLAHWRMEDMPGSFLSVDDQQDKADWSLLFGKFKFGRFGETPVVGDWNGDGITDLGVFKDGSWRLTTVLNNKGTEDDLSPPVGFTFGQAGDIPVVGDWNGDGTSEVGVFKDGIWHLDYNANHQWDGPAGGDRQYGFGQAGDIPVVGYWPTVSNSIFGNH